MGERTVKQRIDEMSIILAEISKDLKHNKEMTEEGFRGVHKRQDTTNGKVLRNAESIEKIHLELGHLHDTKVSWTEYTTNNEKGVAKVVDEKSRLLWFIAKSVVAFLSGALLIYLGTLI